MVIRTGTSNSNDQDAKRILDQPFSGILLLYGQNKNVLTTISNCWE